eukprot:COSAG02_NODE_5745_length_4072_cov_9.799899_3_plen_93_part_00
MTLVIAAFLLPVHSLTLPAAIEYHTTLRTRLEWPCRCVTHATPGTKFGTVVNIIRHDEASPVLAEKTNEIPAREDAMPKSTLVVKLWGVAVT